MSTLSYCGMSWNVDHAVKGPNYIHGYNINGTRVVSIEDTVDFDNIEYDGAYMLPEECISDSCNTLMYVGGTVVRSDGTPVSIPVGGGNASDIDLSNLENGTWTEIIDGEVINHTSVFSEDGTTVTIDGVTVKLG